MWDLEGKHVKAIYQDREVTGMVQSSRVKYGGTVQHEVKLDWPIFLKYSCDPVHYLLIKDEDITSVRDEDMVVTYWEYPV